LEESDGRSRVPREGMVWIRFGGFRFSGISSKFIHDVGFGGGVWGGGGVGWARGGSGGGGGDGDVILLSEDCDRDGLRYSRGLCRPAARQIFHAFGNLNLVIPLPPCLMFGWEE